MAKVEIFVVNYYDLKIKINNLVENFVVMVEITFIHRTVKKILNLVIVIINVEIINLILENSTTVNLLFVKVENWVNIVLVEKVDLVVHEVIIPEPTKLVVQNVNFKIIVHETNENEVTQKVEKLEAYIIDYIQNFMIKKQDQN